MAQLSATSVLFCCCCIFLLAMPNGSSAASKMATYWGQNDDEGSLLDVCNTHFYDIINIAFLSQFGGGKPLKLSLGAHCPNNDCPLLSSDITACKAMNIKILLSIGGPGDSYTLTDQNDAQ